MGILENTFALFSLNIVNELNINKINLSCSYTAFMRLELVFLLLRLCCSKSALYISLIHILTWSQSHLVPSLDLRRSSLGVGLISQKRRPLWLNWNPAASRPVRQASRQFQSSSAVAGRNHAWHGWDSSRVDLNRVWSSCRANWFVYNVVDNVLVFTVKIEKWNCCMLVAN